MVTLLENVVKPQHTISIRSQPSFAGDIMDDELLTAQQVAEKYPVAEATLKYWRHRRTGPRYARLGRRIVYRQSDLDAWVDAQFETSPTPAAS